MKSNLPANLDLSNHVLQFPASQFGVADFNLDKAKYILGLIHSIPSMNKTIANMVNVNGGFTPICSVKLQSVIRDYRSYLNYFLRTGIIITDAKYRPSVFFFSKAKCSGYKFSDIYNNVELIPQTYSIEFNKNLISSRNREFRKSKANYSHLLKWYWPNCSLKIDSKLASKYLNMKMLAQVSNPSLQDDLIDNSGNISKKNPEYQYIYNTYSVDQIAKGEVYFKIDKTVNRLHTNLTSLKSELRNLVTYNGETLYSIDIKSSQPYLTLALFNKDLNKIIKSEDYLSRALPMLEYFYNHVDNQDVRLFIDLVSKSSTQDKDLYLYILSKAKRNGLDYDNRKRVKKCIFEVLFSKNSYQTDSKRFFARVFPTINRLYRNLKSADHTYLACLLQKIESHMVINVITKKFSKLHPNAPLFTIHDSIATTEKYRDSLEKMMSNELTRLTKFPPKLEVEKWSPDKIDWDEYKV